MAGHIEEIAGDPDAMWKYHLGGVQTINPTGLINTKMVEGVQFALKDQKAGILLQKFTTDMSEGFEAYTNGAKTAHLDYLTADQQGADLIKNVTTDKTINVGA